VIVCLLEWRGFVLYLGKGGGLLEFSKNKIKMAGFYSAYPKRWISMVPF